MINLLFIAIFFFLFTKQYIGFVRIPEQHNIYFFHYSSKYQKNKWVVCRINGKTIMGQIQYSMGDNIPLRKRTDIVDKLNGDVVPDNQYVIYYTVDNQDHYTLCHKNNVVGLVIK